MGTWGASNFESDSAREYIDAIIDKLLADIQEHLSPENLPQKSFDVGSTGDHKIIPAIDVYITISREYDYPPIDLETAKQWRAVYLDAYDRDDHSYPEKFKAKRRLFVEETFVNLEKLILDWDIDVSFHTPDK
jgi:hypothetical protein